MYFHQKQFVYTIQLTLALLVAAPKSVENMLQLIGKEECNSIIEEQASITIHCDFCNECYQYSEDEVDFVFNESSNSAKH